MQSSRADIPESDSVATQIDHIDGEDEIGVRDNVEGILKAYWRLKDFPSLEPTEASVAQAFEELVRLCVNVPLDGICKRCLFSY